MDLDLVFLGTSGSAPTAGRAPTALLVRRGGERLLFDCAEGTQRQLMRSSVGLPDLEEIFIGHFHADHYLGLPGMLKTFQLRQRELPLTVYGPPGLRELFNGLRRVFGKLSYPLELVEVRAGEALERDGYRILVFPVHHGVAAVGYAIDEDDRPGRFDNDAADALGIPSGPERGALQRGESITFDDGRVVTPDAVLGEAAPGTARRDPRRHGAGRDRARPRRGRRRARPRGDVLRGGARPGRRHAPLDGAPGGRARTRRRREAARAHARLAALLRWRARRARRATCSRRRSSRATST